MTWQYSPYLLITFAVVLFTAWLVLVSWQRRATRGTPALLIFLLAATVWCFAYTIELAATTLDTKLFWVSVQYIGIVTLPVAWLAFALLYTTPIRPARLRRLILPFAVIPCVTLLLQWSNASHGWFYTDIAIVENNGVLHFGPVYGPWFWVHTIYSYACILAGTLLFLYLYLRLRGEQRHQAAILLVSSLPPFLANFIFIFGDIPYDPAPMMIAASGVLFAWGFFRLNLLGVAPEPLSLPSVDLGTDLAQAWQHSRVRVLNYSLAGTSVLGFVLLLAFVYGALTTAPVNWLFVAVTTAVYGLVLLVSLVRRIPFALRAGVFLTVLYIIALSNIAAYGLNIEVGFALLAFIIFSYLLFGQRFTFYAFGFSFLTVALSNWALLNGRLPLTPFFLETDSMSSLAAMATPLASLSLVALVVIGALVSIYDDIRELLQRSQNLSLALEDERQLLEQRVNERTRALSASIEVSSQLSTILDPDQLVQQVAEQLQRAFEYDHVCIYLWEQAGTRLLLVGESGRGSRSSPVARRPLAPDQGAVGRAATSGKTVRLPDVEQTHDELAQLAIPIRFRGEVLGVLDIHAGTGTRFTDEDVAVLQSLAAQIAVAVQNASLYADQVATAEKLRELDHLKSEFLASMSHELRTPLNSIIGFADVLLAGLDGELNERMAHDVDIIRSSGNHLRELIGDILDMTKIEAGRMELHYTEVDVARVVDEVLRSARISAAEKSLALQVHLNDAVGCIEADETRLRQVLWNIVGNAIKFTEEGQVVVRVEARREHLFFQIEDTGVGIAERDIPAVFERFRQVDTSKASANGGTGLGMPISKHLVEMHGGQIGLQSRVGVGTTVWFTIPQTRTVQGAV